MDGFYFRYREFVHGMNVPTPAIRNCRRCHASPSIRVIGRQLFPRAFFVGFLVRRNLTAFATRVAELYRRNATHSLNYCAYACVSFYLVVIPNPGARGGRSTVRCYRHLLTEDQAETAASARTEIAHMVIVEFAVD